MDGRWTGGRRADEPVADGRWTDGRLMDGRWTENVGQTDGRCSRYQDAVTDSLPLNRAQDFTWIAIAWFCIDLRRCTEAELPTCLGPRQSKLSCLLVWDRGRASWAACLSGTEAEQAELPTCLGPRQSDVWRISSPCAEPERLRQTGVIQPWSRSQGRPAGVRRTQKVERRCPASCRGLSWC